jgi:hypothetical protein
MSNFSLPVSDHMGCGAQSAMAGENLNAEQPATIGLGARSGFRKGRRAFRWREAFIDGPPSPVQNAQLSLTKQPPSLRRRSTSLDHVLRDARLSDLETELEQLAMDARRKDGVLGTHNTAEAVPLPNERIIASFSSQKSRSSYPYKL